ncbi:hypothetical protein ACP70R_026212 [Stipagrostis hirtigluma subsp. patula]
MLRLRIHLLSVAGAASPPAAASLSLHRLLPLSTAAASPARFVAEDFLVTTCGLTPVQALKASKRLSHLKPPSKPEAVLAFLADIGVAKADVAAAIARDPQLLCSTVDKTLAPHNAQLRDIGLSRCQISNLITIAPSVFRRTIEIQRLQFYLSFLGSYEKLHTALLRSRQLLCHDIERVVKPNISFLQQCGLTDCGIVKIFSLAARMVVLEPERVKEIVACADMLGVPRSSAMFKHALVTVYLISPKRVSAKLNFLKKALGWSEVELHTAVCKFPNILNFTEGRLCRVVNFLKVKVGLQPSYIVHRPSLLNYSMDKRLMPRHYILKILKAKGLVKENIDYFNVVCRTEKLFMKKFLDPYKESVPGLADAYASASAGQIPPEIQP